MGYGGTYPQTALCFPLSMQAGRIRCIIRHEKHVPGQTLFGVNRETPYPLPAPQQHGDLCSRDHKRRGLLPVRAVYGSEMQVQPPAVGHRVFDLPDLVGRLTFGRISISASKPVHLFLYALHFFCRILDRRFPLPYHMSIFSHV